MDITIHLFIKGRADISAQISSHNFVTFLVFYRWSINSSESVSLPRRFYCFAFLSIHLILLIRLIQLCSLGQTLSIINTVNYLLSGLAQTRLIENGFLFLDRNLDRVYHFPTDHSLEGRMVVQYVLTLLPSTTGYGTSHSSKAQFPLEETLGNRAQPRLCQEVPCRRAHSL